MNGKKAKQVRRDAKYMMMAWFDSLLPDDQKGQTSFDAILSQIPQSYVYSIGTARHSAYSYKWFQKAAKLKYKHG